MTHRSSIHRRSKIKLALVLVILAGIAVLLWRPVQQARAVAALQEACDPDTSLQFEFGDEDTEEGSRFARLAESAMDRVLPWFFHDREALSNYEKQFRGLVRRPVQVIYIEALQSPRGDVGAALAQFPALEKLNVEDYNLLPQHEWTVLVTTLRTMPQLREIVLESTGPRASGLNDASLSPISGHPTLRNVLLLSSFTPACVDTLATLPSLEQLLIEPSPAWTEAEWTSFCTRLHALPHLKELFVEGWQFTDAPLAALAGHPTLESLVIRKGVITPACAASLAKIPRLQWIGFESVSLKFSPEERKAFSAALPKVSVEFP